MKRVSLLIVSIIILATLMTSEGQATVQLKAGDMLIYNSTLISHHEASNVQGYSHGDGNTISSSSHLKILKVSKDLETIQLSDTINGHLTNTFTYSVISFVNNFADKFLVFDGHSLPQSKLSLTTNFASISPFNFQNLYIPIFVNPDWSLVGQQLSKKISNFSFIQGRELGYLSLRGLLTGANTSFEFNGVKDVNKISDALNTSNSAWKFSYYTKSEVSNRLAENSFSFELSYRTSGLLDHFTFKRKSISYRQISKQSSPIGNQTVTPPGTTAAYVQRDIYNQAGFVTVNSSAPINNPNGLLDFVSNLGFFEIGTFLGSLVLIVLFYAYFRTLRKIPKASKEGEA